MFVERGVDSLYLCISPCTPVCFLLCWYFSPLIQFVMCYQYIVESARQRPAKRRISSGGRKSLYQKLYELYMEECEKEPELKVCAMQHVSHLSSANYGAELNAYILNAVHGSWILLYLEKLRIYLFCCKCCYINSKLTDSPHSPQAVRLSFCFSVVCHQMWN